MFQDETSSPPDPTSDLAQAGSDAAPNPPGGIDGWLDMLDGTGLDPRLQALTILVAAGVLAKLLDWTVTLVLHRIAKRTKVRVDDEIVARLHSPLLRSTVVVGLAFASRALARGAQWGNGLEVALFTIAVIIWIPFAFRASSFLLRAASEDPTRFRTIEPRTYPLFDNLAKMILFAAFVYWIFCDLWGFDPAGLIASAGIAGLAIGFAAQDTLSNLFAGVFIIADAPYRVGDFITLDSGERGEVRQIGLRSTRLLTRDDIEVTIPNSVMGAAKITNEAGGPSPKHRIRVKVSAAYGADIDLVRSTLLESAEAVDTIVDIPEPRVRFRAFGDSGLEFELLGWIGAPIERGATLDTLHTDIYKRFIAAGLEIPFPKRDVYLHQVPSEVAGEDEAT